MPFDLEQAVTDFCRHPTVKQVFGNPLISSLIIVVIVCLMVFLTESEYGWEEGRRTIQIGFWTYLGTLVVNMMHYKIIEEEFIDKTKHRGREEIMATVHQTDALTPELLTQPKV